MTSEYAGQSLAFVRQIKGLNPVYRDVAAAMAETLIIWSEPDEAIPVGHLVWFENDGPAGGDVGIALDDHLMLCLVEGTPFIKSVFGPLSAMHGIYVGHSATIGSESIPTLEWTLDAILVHTIGRIESGAWDRILLQVLSAINDRMQTQGYSDHIIAGSSFARPEGGSDG